MDIALSRRVIGGLIAGGLGINAVLWMLAAWLFPKETPAAVLHYTIGIGIDLIGEGSQIYALPIIGLLLLAGNVWLSWMVWRASRRAVWVLLIGAIAIQVILLTAFLFLWNLNR